MNYQKNDRITITIEDIGAKGEGIGKIDGYTFFVKDAILGDVITAKIMKSKKNYAYVRLEEVVKPSSFRVVPKCKVAKQCGGCQIQALSYEKQLEYKENKVRNQLIRIGKFEKNKITGVMKRIKGMDNPYHYRNKAQFPVRMNKEGKVVTGFYAERTHSIINNTSCLIGVEENELILQIILQFMMEYRVSAYCEDSKEGLVRHVLIRKGFATNELMVCIVINGNVFPYEEILVERLQEINEIVSIYINFNTKITNVILGEEAKCIWGKGFIEDYIGAVKFQISPQSFYQVNPVQTKVLYECALSLAELTGNEIVWDLYCGIGTISLFLSRKAKHVYGVELVPQAIEDAKRNATINGITNTTFYCGKAEEVLPREYEQHGVYADVIVVDPPRKGCDEKCLETMVAMSPKRIVYVSCDSATLARDLEYLCKRGYDLRQVQPVDQFCHTIHCECVASLQLARIN